MKPKYVIVIPDGCADEPQASLGGRTPLQAARTPNMDRIARQGIVGQANHVPRTLTPASDVATLSLFGYDPLRYYTGRAPLETAAMGIHLGPDDWAIRCNLVTLIDGVMVDFTAGHISKADARALITDLNRQLGGGRIECYPGVSYRNIVVYRGQGAAAPFSAETTTTPPHDLTDRDATDHWPRGPGAPLMADLMRRSQAILAGHALNRERRERGDRPATSIWLWGQGKAPDLPRFEDRYGVRGAIISAVDLVRGVGQILGWQRIDVATATGYVDTDYAAKGRAGVAALDQADLVCVHVEAPDEASHEGKADLKAWVLEQIDEQIVGPLLTALEHRPEPWRILVSPDHPTPVRLKTHVHGPVPFALMGSGIAPGRETTYDEPSGARGPWQFDPGHELMPRFLAIG